MRKSEGKHQQITVCVHSTLIQAYSTNKLHAEFVVINDFYSKTEAWEKVLSSS
jgi:hypothetical protein